MNQQYHDTIEKMEKMGVDNEYINGWIGGYLHNPLREEQRITDGYTAGYEDGKSNATGQMDKWVKK